MESTTFNELYFLEFMPKINEYKGKFDSLNGLLNKTTLTGKISSLEIAENLFTFMDETQQKFSALQANLIKTLLSENVKKVVTELSQIAELGACITARFLFELNALTFILSKDKRIIEAFGPSGDMPDIKRVAEAYLNGVTLRYKVIEDIKLLDKNGTIKLSIDKRNVVRHSNEPFINKALESNDAIIVKGSLEIEPHNPYSFIYAKRVEDENNNILGLILVSINIADEIKHLFDSLNYGAKGLALSLFDEKDYVISSSHIHDFVPSTKISLRFSGKYGFIKYRNKEYIVSFSHIKSKNENINSKWKAVMFIPMKSAFLYDLKNSTLEGEIKEEDFSDTSSLMTEELQNIMYEAENINEDLGDVVINGEIIASKSHSYSLNPILDNIRILSEEINKVCIDSIKDLQQTILYSSVEGAKFLGLVALSTIDRLFYFTSNLATIIGKNKKIFEILSDKKELNSKISELNQTLKELISHHNEYANIFVCDNDGVIITSTVDSQTKRSIESHHLFKAKSITTEHPYYVSDFEKSFITDDRYGFVVYSTISDCANNIVGCVGIAIDTKEQFLPIITNCLPKNEHGELKKSTIGVIATKTKKVVVSSDPQIEIGSILELDDRFFKQQSGKGIAKVIDFMGSRYIVGSAKSIGYRDFNSSENKVCELYAFIFIKI